MCSGPNIQTFELSDFSGKCIFFENITQLKNWSFSHRSIRDFKPNGRSLNSRILSGNIYYIFLSKNITQFILNWSFSHRSTSYWTGVVWTLGFYLRKNFLSKNYTVCSKLESFTPLDLRLQIERSIWNFGLSVSFLQFK